METEPLAKSYGIVYAGKFILDDPAIRSRLKPEQIERVKAIAGAVPPTVFAPRSMVSELCSIIATNTDDATAHLDINRAGQAIAAYATNSFLKIMLKMIPPWMFAAKFSDIWGRDFRNSGRAEVEPSDKKSLVLRLVEVGDFAHVGPLVEGYIGFALRQMGVTVIESTAVPWSIAEPAAPEVRITARWQ
jgi:hypothetical protein